MSKRQRLSATLSTIKKGYYKCGHCGGQFKGVHGIALHMTEDWEEKMERERMTAFRVEMKKWFYRTRRIRRRAWEENAQEGTQWGP